MSTDYPGAIDMIITDPAWVFTDALTRVDNQDITIINHKTACGAPCTATQIAQDFHNNTRDHKSVHFVVGRDGSVIQVVLLKDGAGGNCCTSSGYNNAYYDPLFAKYGGNANLFTVSIEHEDWTTDNSQVMPQAQIDASNKLNWWLCKRYGIGPANIHSHASLDPVNRSRCPGVSFSFPQLFAYIAQQQGKPTVPNPFIAQAALDTWMSSGLKLSTGSGIAKEWFRQYINGNLMPPPSGPEFASVDWNGHPIVVQFFASLRAEWNNGHVTWYLATGGL